MEIDPNVLEMVREQLDRDPPPSTAALYGRAAQMNEDIYGLSLRQFHALYPLRIKRERSRRDDGGDRESAPTSPAAEREGRKAADLDEDARERIRRVLENVAREVVRADSVEALDAVIGNLPERADEIARILTARG